VGKAEKKEKCTWKLSKGKPAGKIKPPAPIKRKKK